MIHPESREDYNTKPIHITRPPHPKIGRFSVTCYFCAESAEDR